jgi:aldose 1-epimerase
MIRAIPHIVWLAMVSSTFGSEVTVRVDSETGWRVYSLHQGSTVAQVVPRAGCNVFSIQVDGIEYLRVPEKLKNLPGFEFGNPILYPTPNRVRGAQFSFRGQRFKFEPNNGSNFLHGLVHSAAWNVVGTDTDQQRSEIRCELPFKPGTAHHALFPFEHVLRVTISVKDGAVRWTYEVDNRLGTEAVPFGVAYHPYFVYQGRRAQTYLRVPASHLMESIDLLPTGKLLELGGTKYDLRKPKSLDSLVLDDVFFGMSQQYPVEIEFRDVKRQITLRASNDFTHLVVFTPQLPFLCVENQTCSTDAHNLHDQGQSDVSHLLICPAGEMMAGWAEYQFESHK